MVYHPTCGLTDQLAQVRPAAGLLEHRGLLDGAVPAADGAGQVEKFVLLRLGDNVHLVSNLQHQHPTTVSNQHGCGDFAMITHDSGKASYQNMGAIDKQYAIMMTENCQDI